MIKLIKNILHFIFYPFIWLFKKIFKKKQTKKEFYIQDIEALRAVNINIKSVSIQRTSKEGLKYSILGNENIHQGDGEAESLEEEAGEERQAQEGTPGEKESATPGTIEKSKSERSGAEKKKRGRPKKKA